MLAGPKTKCFCGNIKIKLSFWPNLHFIPTYLSHPSFSFSVSWISLASYVKQACLLLPDIFNSGALAQSFQAISACRECHKGRQEEKEERITCTEFSDTAYRTFSIPGLSADPERFDVSSRNSPGSFQCERKLPPSSALIGYSSLQSERNAEQAQQPQEGGFNSVYRQPIGSLLHKIENIQFNRNLNPLCVCTTNSTTARQSSANEQLKHLNADHFCLCSSFSISVAFETFEWETVNITTQTLFCFHNRCCSC